jgi:hypothetical protein
MKHWKPSKLCGRTYAGEITKWRNETTRARRVLNRLRRSAKHRER